MQILIKLLVAALAGGGTYILCLAVDQQNTWRLALAIFVAGVILIVQFLIDLLEQSRRSTALIRKMNEAATILVETEETLGSEDMTRLVKEAGGLRGREELQSRFLHEQISGLIDLVSGLRSGRAAYEGDNPGWLVGLTDAAAVSIDAVSLTSFANLKGFVDEARFWASEPGQRILLRQLAATQRDVRIRRLFILVESNADPALLTELIKPHREIGAEVRVLRPERIPRLRQRDLAAFTVFDQRICYEFETAMAVNETASPFTNVALVVAPKAVDRRREAFEELWSAAEVIA